MISTFQFHQQVSFHLLWILFHAVWQGVLIGLVIWGVTFSLRKMSADVRYAINVTGLWFILLIPVLSSFVSPGSRIFRGSLKTSSLSKRNVTDSRKTTLSESENHGFVLSNWQHQQSVDPSKSVPSNSAGNVSASISSGERDLPKKTWWQVLFSRLSPKLILLGWALGVVLFSLRFFLGYVWILRVSTSRTAINPKIFSRIERLYQNQKWRVIPRVFASNKISEAIVVGYFRPMVLVPISWTTQLAPETLEAIIVHELTHIRRFDLWVILMQRIAETLLFFHPVVWWISKRVSIERELCCDAESVRILESSVSYAKALENVATRLLEQSQRTSLRSQWMSCNLFPNIGGQKMELLARIQHVLQLSPGPQVSRSRRPRHGIFMLLIPIMVIGTGLSLVQVFAEEQKQQSSFSGAVKTSEGLDEKQSPIRRRVSQKR